MNKIEPKIAVEILSAEGRENEIIFQSSEFPRFHVTKKQYLHLRLIYPKIVSIQDALIAMELRLGEDPRKAPTHNWLRTIINHLYYDNIKVIENEQRQAANKVRYAHPGDNRIPKDQAAVELKQMLTLVPVQPDPRERDLQHIADAGKMVQQNHSEHPLDMAKETKTQMTIEEQREYIKEKFGVRK